MIKPEPLLYLSDARGVYIPRDFIRHTLPECMLGVSAYVADTLRAGPDHDGYWDAWCELERFAVVVDPTTGVRYSVYQDGDCWLIPEGMEWDDALAFYVWPSDEEQS